MSNHPRLRQAYEIIRQLIPDDVPVFMFSNDRFVGAIISEEWRLQLKWYDGKVLIQLAMRPLNKGISWIHGFKDREKFCGVHDDPQTAAVLFVEEFNRCKTYTPGYKLNKTQAEVQEYISQQPGAYQVWVMPYDVNDKHIRYNHDPDEDFDE